MSVCTAVCIVTIHCISVIIYMVTRLFVAVVVLNTMKVRLLIYLYVSLRDDCVHVVLFV